MFLFESHSQHAQCRIFPLLNVACEFDTLASFLCLRTTHPHPHGHPKKEKVQKSDVSWTPKEYVFLSHLIENRVHILDVVMY